jgi:hypothetical protein
MVNFRKISYSYFSRGINQPKFIQAHKFHFEKQDKVFSKRTEFLKKYVKYHILKKKQSYNKCYKTHQIDISSLVKGRFYHINNSTVAPLFAEKQFAREIKPKSLPSMRGTLAFSRIVKRL